MSGTISTLANYDGSIVTTPQQVVRPSTVEELQMVLKDPARYPSPVRPMGSFHSLTPCVSSPGTIVDMRGLNKIISIDREKMTFTAQAGLQMIEANRVLREQNLQFMLNIEIGNMTIGSAACCHSKDSLDGVELGQVNSYVIGIKWVTPSGELRQASEEENPDLLPLMRASYGLAGIVYEVTFRIKPLEIVRFNYHLHDAGTLSQDQVSEAIASNQSIVCWTVERTVVIQSRNSARELRHEWLAGSRRFGWNFLAAFAARAIREQAPDSHIDRLEDLGAGIELAFYRLLSATGGFTLRDCDKMIDYSKTPESARYAFTFWAFPLADWVANLRSYLEFTADYFDRHGFRCNMPLGSYFIRQDRHSLLSYSYDGDIISIDPIHAPGERDKEAWKAFLHAFNDWASERGGIPLFNQSPFVKKEHVLAAYGDRWITFSNWVRSVDPQRRMLNQFFEELLE